MRVSQQLSQMERVESGPPIPAEAVKLSGGDLHKTHTHARTPPGLASPSAINQTRPAIISCAYWSKRFRSASIMDSSTGDTAGPMPVSASGTS